MHLYENPKPRGIIVMKINGRGKGEGSSEGSPCQHGRLKHLRTVPACYSPQSVVSDVALTGYNACGIINSGAGCVYFKALRRGCMGSDGISLEILRGGALNTVQPIT